MATNSNDTLKITYAHLNVVSGDTIGYETQQIGMNVSNGITWKMNKRFFDSSGAKAAFARSLERWRCGTFINWDTLGQVNHSSIKSDGVNMCAWDTSSSMPSGVLAQCFSYWSGCFTPGLKWFVNELDIRFRVKPTTTTNWNYTTGNATAAQFHFESVATHELGHGHQLGHVINSAVVMHYAIANGQTKPNLSTNDISAGNYVITKSATSICGKNAHTKLNSGNCAMISPNSNFSMSSADICKDESIIFTDSSQGNISGYLWNFGVGATPATANTKGPHTVTYSSGGVKTVSLTITTIQGNLQKTKTANVRADSRMVSNFTYTAAEKGKLSFTNTSNNPSSNTWYFGDGDSSSITHPKHIYASGGTFSVKLKSTNTCNTKDTTIPVKFAWLNFYNNPVSVCINDKVTYFDSSDNNVATWQWAFPGATPSSANGKGPHTVTYASAGEKSATLNITVSGAPNQSYTQDSLVTVSTDTFTKASFIFGYYGKNLVGFQNTSQGSGMTYKWYFGDGDSSTSKDPIHQYVNANNQNVRLVVSGNCNTDDTTIQLRDFTTINPIAGLKFFSLFPNPSNKHIVVSSNIPENLDIEIMDATGKAVLSNRIISGEKLSIEILANGLYFVKIHNDNLVETTRLIIQH
jgi:PKD repeat protein